MKRNKIFVAITGGIGSGKSTVAEILSGLGYPVFSADAVAREIYKDPTVFKRVSELFPQCVEGDSVNRKKLAETVFADASKLAQLNALTHPIIMRRLFLQMQECRGEIAFAEVPLLFESGSAEQFDKVIIVMRSEPLRTEAVMKRDGLTREAVAARIKNQYDYERNLNTGHTVLYNDGDISALKCKVVRIVNEIVRNNRQ